MKPATCSPLHTENTDDSSPLQRDDAELLARIRRDVARQLADLERPPKPRWRDEAEYWGVVLALALCVVILVLAGKP